jgi:hypothetical protein
MPVSHVKKFMFFESPILAEPRISGWPARCRIPGWTAGECKAHAVGRWHLWALGSPCLCLTAAPVTVIEEFLKACSHSFSAWVNKTQNVCGVEKTGPTDTTDDNYCTYPQLSKLKTRAQRGLPLVNHATRSWTSKLCILTVGMPEKLLWTRSFSFFSLVPSTGLWEAFVGIRNCQKTTIDKNIFLNFVLKRRIETRLLEVDERIGIQYKVKINWVCQSWPSYMTGLLADLSLVPG